MFGFLVQRYRRIFVALVILVIVISAARLAIPEAVSAYRTLYVVSRVVPALPQWFERGSYGVEILSGQAVPDEIDVYLPKGRERAPFVIFFPGFNPDGARDPRIVNLARAFAGAGVGVAIPRSENIKQQKFSREDIDLIKDTFQFLAERDYVDRERIGLSGFSIAGSYVLRAAGELGEGPLFVHASGAYYDLAEVFREAETGVISYRGEERTWAPSDLSKEVAGREFNKAISEEEAGQISPASVLGDIKTRVFLMHDKNDDRIPVEHSRKIRDALPKNVAVSYSEFLLFQHVTPKSILSFDILKLSGQIFSIMKLLLL